MTWQTQVAAWVIPLLQEYVVPDNATVQNGVDFADLDDSLGATNFTTEMGTGSFPGVVPDYSVVPEINPTTGGLNYIVKARKAVGFYGLLATVLSYDPQKINDWRYPIDRKKFGFITMSRNGKVLHAEPLSYVRQYFLANTVISLLANFDEQFFIQNIFNSADKLCLTSYEFAVSPTVRLRIAPLPIWEVWAIRWFQSSGG